MGTQIIISDINHESLKKTTAEFHNEGYFIDSFAAHVSNREPAHVLLQYAISKYGKLDILVNNAEISKDVMLHKMTPEQWDNLIGVNLSGVFNCLLTREYLEN